MKKKWTSSQINYFSSTLIFANYRASPPTSIIDKGKYIVPLSDIETTIDRDEADTAPSSPQFPQLFFMKNGDDGAVSASSLKIIVYLISGRNKEKENFLIFSLFLSDNE